MTKIKPVLKWVLRVFGVLLLCSLAIVLFINKELKQMYGGNAKIVDDTQFAGDVTETIVIKQVGILSPDADSILEHKTVLVKAGKIDWIGDDYAIPDNSTVIDGTGKYLIPGLIDAHVHLWQSPNDLLLYLANGITAIRELKGSDHHLEWRDEISSGQRLGPHLYVATSKFQSKSLFAGWFLHWTQGDIILNHPNKAREVLLQLKTKGYDCIKIGSFLNQDNYLAVNVAAKELGIPVVGHFPYYVDIDNLWTANQVDVVHIEEFVKHINKEFGRVGNANKEEFLILVEQRGIAIAQKLANTGIAVTTTLLLTEYFPRLKNQMEAVLREVELKYVNPGLVEGTVITKKALGWLPKVNPYRQPEHLTAEKKINNQAYWETYAKANQILLRIFNASGVTLMAGTDANIPVVVPGFSLHDELISMEQVGMSPSQILRSATSTPAAWMGMKTGKIQVGYQADLILLNKNPLESIEHTKTIETVILGGIIFRRHLLDAMLKAVEDANNSSRKINIDAYLK